MTQWIIGAAAYAWIAFSSFRRCDRSKGKQWLIVTVCLLWPLTLLLAIGMEWRRPLRLEWWRGLAQRQRVALGLTAIEPVTYDIHVKGSVVGRETGQQIIKDIKAFNAGPDDGGFLP